MPKSKHKIVCLKCDRSISASAFMSHLRANESLHGDILEDIESYRIALEAEVRLCKVCCKPIPKQSFSSNEAMSHMHGIGIHILECCSKECRNHPWNKGLTKEDNASLLRLAESRKGSNNPIHKVINDSDAKERWIENILKSRSDYDKGRLGKSLEELYGKEKAASAKKRMSEAAKNRKHHGHTGFKHSLEARRKIGKKTAEFLSKSHLMTSRPQRLLFEALREVDESVILEHCVGYYTVDIAVPDIQLAIEVDGDFYHVNESLGYEPIYPVQKRNLKNDKKKSSYLANSGWAVIRYWVSDIEKDIQCIVRQIVSKIHMMRSSQ